MAFSFAKGIFHPYYVSLLAPFTAALVGAAAGLALGRDQVARVVGPLAVAGGVVTELMVLDNITGQFGWLPPVLIVGGIALALALAVGTSARVRNAVLVAALALPAAAVALSPWTDLALTGPSLAGNAAADPMLTAAQAPALARYYLGGADPRHPYASPLYGDHAGLPPSLIQVGSDEILRDDAVRMADRLRAAGCRVELEVWPRMPHVWQLFARVLDNARYLRDGLRALGFEVHDVGPPVTTPVIPVVVGDDWKAVLLWRALYDAGVYVNVALHPAVPPAGALLRTSVMATHDRSTLDRALQAFSSVKSAFEAEHGPLPGDARI